jgi:uncharacterized membrane protein YccC
MAIAGFDSLRRALRGRWLPGVRRAFRGRWQLGVRAALSVGVPLLAGVIAGRPGWGAVASFGGFAGFYAASAPRRHRVRMLAGTGAALTVVVLLGSLCSSRPWLAVLFAGATAGVASFVFLALRVPPPREYLIVLAALAATGVPENLPGALREAALVAGGAVVASGVALTPTLGQRHALPQVRALSAAWSALAAVLNTAGTPAAAPSRERALAAVGQAREVLRQAGAAAGGRRSLAAAEIVLASALSVSIEASTPLDPWWAESLQHLTGPAPGPAAAPPPPASPGHADLPGLRWALTQAGQVRAGDGPGPEGSGDEPRGVARQLREALSPHAVILPAAARIGVVVLAGFGLGRILGLEHSYWVGLTAAAVLQANNVTFLIRRAANRIAGTIVGVGLAGLLFVSHPAVIAVVAAAICAQFASEVLIPVSYGLSVTVITVVALAVYDLAASGAGVGTAIGARVLDTLIGAGLAVLLRLVLWPGSAAARLPLLQARTLRATATVFRSRWLSDQAGLRDAQRGLQDTLLNLHAVYQDTRADRRLVPPVTAGDQLTPAVEELAWLALGIPFGRTRPASQAAQALAGRIEQLADALSSGAVPPRAVDPLTLPGYPRTQATASLLESLIGR